MKSLRRRFLFSLWIAVSAVGVISAAIAYLQVSHQAKDLLDNRLQQIAGVVAPRTVNVAHPPKSDDDDIEVAIWGLDGTLQYSSAALKKQQRVAKTGFSDVLLGTEPFRVYTALVDGRYIQVAQSMDAREDQAEDAALAALLPILILMPVLAIVIAFVIRALLQPVKDIAAAVARRDTFANAPLQAQGLPTEVIPLVEEINRLLARQREAAQRERLFISDAAHALRTPLAALQLQADVLDGSCEPAERAARLADLRAGIQRITRLSNELLSLAKIESVTDTAGAVADLDATLAEVQAQYSAAASAACVTLGLDARSHAQVRGDPRRLILIFGNLLDNALRYTSANGRVDLLAASDREAVRIEVWDEGPGLAQEELGRVFERFYRLPGEQSTGSGLGLATVESLVRQLGGRISLHNRSDRSGLIARVLLPHAEHST